MKAIFHIQGTPDGGLKFKSDYHRGMFKQFLKENPNIKLKITPNEEISGELRRFFEGAVCPYFALQHFVFDSKLNQYVKMTREEARECLKREFNPTYFRDITGKTVKEGETTTKLNKKEFQVFLDRIFNYFEQNGYEFPNSIEYNNWIDTVPDIGEEYPPLQRLIELSEKQLLKLNGYET